MLVVSLNPGESVRIRPDIVVKVLDRKNGHVRIGIEAPKHVKILRSELERKEVDARPTT